ncbi:beta-ketoacyl synthase domain-containing protein [Colletotrichum graminicola]|uniref:Beta-ketoacyl synthase domain-containing protein n=1 Tax=Colletotrichum graminicola (strain M1.001 / M2 / FGSC 10212) TaxID=645133 RepID=E3QZV7_COLGM|nr:beta-ketoacyl synthase domain-containing protein [Colletotrichum graminicola M1.001]EFQ36395.1 beta-ketoacyl synthase domain-containing protein [Colletotrichum graminicola M1.001]WDK18406.1 beta-ketoacyl synthase domain-containing protein [Colletotrichum graminicola]
MGSIIIGLDEDIAIIGMACRFPGDATSPSKLWDLLMEGKSAWSEVPASRWNQDAHYHPSQERAGSNTVKGGHFLRDDEQNGKKFDAAFFNITHKETETMDLQQRIVMENVYEAIESAGLRLEDVKGSKTSVFAAQFTDDVRSILQEDPDLSVKYKPIGTSAAILAARVSWFYDLRGASFTLDTACSGSIVALHTGAQDLRAGLSDMSIITGVNIIESPEFMFRASGLGMVSPDGKCYSLDARANGYGRGEGVGTLILKPVSAAIRDGNVIRAVLRGTGVNSDGRGTGGITLPNKAAQECLIRDVYARHNLNPDETGFLEGHFTGTPAGDPIEASAIAAVFQRGGPRAAADRPSLYVGAVKANIGHVEAASGMAQVIKTVMVLENGVIPPNTNFEKINPRIPIDRWGLKLPLSPTPFEAGPSGIRRASINSFGFGGTNAHVVLDDAKSYLDKLGLGDRGHLHATKPGKSALKTPGKDNCSSQQAAAGHKVFFFSANDQEGISRVFAGVAEHLQKQTGENGTCQIDDAYLSSLAMTLSERRSRLSWRLALTADSFTSLLAALTDPTTSASAVRPGRATTPAAAFIFTGQGAQWFAMGRELLVFDVFRASVAEADRFIGGTLSSGFSVLEELTQPSAETSKIDQPLYSQTLCTVLQVALVDLLASWKLTPKRVIGHSSGEIAAAYAAGALDRKSAWKVAYYRGVVSAKPAADNNARGAMVAVGCTASEVAPLIAQIHEKLGADGELVIACYNSPRSLTISGDETKVDALIEAANDKKLFARKLRVAKAYHSRHMIPVSEEYRSLMGTLRAAAAVNGLPSSGVHVMSSVTGGLIAASDMTQADYWVQNLVSPVRFSQALVALCTSNVAKKQLKVGGGAELPVSHLVEIGPHGALQAAARDAVLNDPNHKALRYVSILTRGKHACATALHAVGALAAAGLPIDLAKVNSNGGKGNYAMLVDLPPYPFLHTKETYSWLESRTSRAWRFRKHARHDVLGAPVRDWDPDAPRWRNHLRVSEVPWLRDHKVTDSIVVAGVTYLVMAIEAVRQLYGDKGEVPLGFNLRDVSISRAFQVSEDEHTETMLSMKRVAESRQSDSSLWWEWKVTSFSAHDDTWLEHSRGQIAAETAAEISTGVIDGGREERERSRYYKELLSSVTRVCTAPQTELLPSRYAELERIGLGFGRLFRNISSMYSSSNGDSKTSGQALGTIRIPDIATAMPGHALAASIIHPPVFDSIMQSFIFALQASAERLTEPMVPVAIRSVWVSAGIEARPGTELTVHAAAGRVGHKKAEADITAWSTNPDADRPVRVVMRGIEAVPLQHGTTAGDAAGSRREICFNLDWKPDVDILEANGEAETCIRTALLPLETPALQESALKQLGDVQLACAIWITEAVKKVEARPLADENALPEHMKKYLGWLRLIANDYKNNKVFRQDVSWPAVTEDATARDRFLAEYEASGHPEAAMICRIGRNIAPILRGDVDGLHLLFGMDDLLERVYRVSIGTQKIHALMGAYARILSHKRGADLKVLEIGAGTGGTTTSILEAVCPAGTRVIGDSRLLKYTYTDISPSFFETAAAKFGKWKAGGVIEFKTLDIEKDVEEQGFDLASYDLIIAANCLHATSDITKTMARVNSLLKPNGKLFLQETTELRCLESPLVFGMLAGWWAAKEDFRPWGPLLDGKGWERVLREAGFSQTVLELKDSTKDELHVQSMVVATRPADEEVANKSQQLDEEDILRRVFVVAHETPEDIALATFVASAVSEMTDLGVSVVHFIDLEQHDLANTCCIVVMEATKPFLSSSFSEAEFVILRHLLTKAGGLLWLTLHPHENPHMAMIPGLLRTVRWERNLDGSDLLLLHLPSAKASLVAANVVKVFKHHFSGPFLSLDRHADYLVDPVGCGFDHGGVIQTARIIAAPPVNDFIAQRTTVLQPRLQAFGADQSRSLKLHTSMPGDLDKLHFVDWPGAQQPLGDDEVQVEIKAAGLNFRDVMVAMGELDNNTLGYEGAGIVTHVGDEVTDIKAGDRVIAVWNGDNNCLQTRTRVPRDLVAKIPNSMSFEEAAGIPVVFVTAYFCLYEVARLKAGETILVHAAAGGTGQAVIQLAKHLGAEVYATVSSREKMKLLMEQYGLAEDHIFSSRDLSFASGIMRMTGGKGVDVVVNSLSGEALRASFNCIAMFGRFVEIGKRDIMANGKIDMLPFSRCATFTAVDLAQIATLARPLTSRIMRSVVDLHAAGKLHACRPLNVHTFGEMEDAFRILQQGKHIGKVVLKAHPEDLVKVVPKPPAPTRLRLDATYLLPGGVGGLGRSIAKWMAAPAQGAKNIVFLSRGGAEAATTRQLLAELADMGVRAIALKCNVADEAQLVAALAELNRLDFPRIAGVIQGAMQLRDSAFEFMSHAQWEECLGPKVQGTWNLHKYLPADMDFFVMLGSVAGLVGNRGQSNYAAGNTFQDALAIYRRTKGLAATCIDLCNVMSVGFVAENQETLNKNPLFFYAHDGIREDEFLSLVEFHLDAERAGCQGQPQIGVGLAPLSVFKERGLPEPTFIKSPLFRQLRSSGESGATADAASDQNGGTVSVTRALKSAQSPEAAAKIICDALVQRISRTMRIPEPDIDVGKPIHVYGVDSLVAMEIRNYVASECGYAVSVLEIMSNKSTEVLSGEIAKGSKFVRNGL